MSSSEKEGSIELPLHVRRVPPPPVPPEKCEAKAPKAEESPAELDVDGDSNTSGVGEAKLCLPSARWTLLSSLLASIFMFMGLLAFSFSELGLPGLPLEFGPQLLLRVAGWAFMFYLPIFVVSAPLVRNYAMWALRPEQALSDAWPDSAERGRLRRLLRCCGVPLALNVSWATIWTLLICVPVRDGDHFGMFPVFVLGNVLSLPTGILLVSRLGPAVLSKHYALMTAPSCVFFPIFGFAAVVAGYITLRRIAGVWIGILMPLVLSIYEFLGTILVAKIFMLKFLTKRKVRESYAGTNQGVIVSMAICNLHALAEGARLTLLYVDGFENPSPSILIPIVSGVLWNVLLRIGFMDRCLHLVSCQRWKPNNCSKLLRESGYCMGYPRFGAIGALLLARLCIGTALPGESPRMLLLLGVLLAEVVEDLLSCALWHLNVNLSPSSSSLTASEVEKISRGRLARRLASVLPSTDVSLSVSPAPPSRPVCSSEFLPTIQWKVRVVDDFIYGPEDFGKLPFWAHLLPTALAQFHTILAMIVFSNGPLYILGLCNDLTGGSHEFGVLWWPVAASRCEG